LIPKVKTAVPIVDPSEPVEPTPSCKYCVKNGVCLIVRTVKGLGEQFTKEEKSTQMGPKVEAPFDYLKFSEICNEYIPSFHTAFVPKLKE